MLLIHANYLDEDFRLVQGDIEIEDGKILRVGKDLPRKEEDLAVDCAGSYTVVPGFVDEMCIRDSSWCRLWTAVWASGRKACPGRRGPSSWPCSTGPACWPFCRCYNNCKRKSTFNLSRPGFPPAQGLDSGRVLWHNTSWYVMK